MNFKTWKADTKTWFKRQAQARDDRALERGEDLERQGLAALVEQGAIAPVRFAEAQVIPTQHVWWRNQPDYHVTVTAQGAGGAGGSTVYGNSQWVVLSSAADYNGAYIRTGWKDGSWIPQPPPRVADPDFWMDEGL